MYNQQISTILEVENAIKMVLATRHELRAASTGSTTLISLPVNILLGVVGILEGKILIITDQKGKGMHFKRMWKIRMAT